jgi:hypothetical protein
MREHTIGYKINRKLKHISAITDISAVEGA